MVPRRLVFSSPTIKVEKRMNKVLIKASIRRKLVFTSPEKRIPAPKKPVLGKRVTRSMIQKPLISPSKISGIVFPVDMVYDQLKTTCQRSVIEKTAAVYCASVLEYLTAEVLELAGSEAKKSGSAEVNPIHIQLAIKNDEDFRVLLQNTFFIDEVFLPDLKFDELMAAITQKKRESRLSIPKKKA